MYKIRQAKKADSLFIYQKIKDLAKFEKAEDQVLISADQLVKDGFEEEKLFNALIIDLDSTPIGFALYYNRYSTWKGKSLYLEDLYIDEAHRKNGLGLKTMKYLAQLARDTACNRFEWQVLDWNMPAINLYKKIGANLDSEWINCKLEGPEIVQFISQDKYQI